MDIQLATQHHQALLSSEKGMTLAKAQGFTDEIIKTLRIGYIEKEGRITYPIFDETGSELLQIRKCKPGAKQYRILPMVTGLGSFLYPTCNVGSSLNILVGGEKDAINVMGHWGLASVSSTGGEGSWNDDWSELFRGHEVIICYDFDETGQKGALRVADKLYGIAASIKIVIDQLPYENPKEDLTDLIQREFPLNEFWDIVHKTPVWRPTYDIMTTVERRGEDGWTVFEKTPYRFEVKEDIGKSNKTRTITLFLIENDKDRMLYRNAINLDKAAQRKQFNIEDYDQADHDLVTIADLLERQAKAEYAKATKPKQAYTITKDEQAAAEAYLRETPHLLTDVMKTTDRLGVVGEWKNRMIVYLVFTSRIMATPLSLLIKGESGSGKSYTSQQVMILIPDEGIKYITRATAQAFYHLPEDGMRHKIIFINEQNGSEQADYAIRSAQSEGDLVLNMPVKDPMTGEMTTIDKVVKGPAGFMTTTTKNSVFHENETRNLSAWTDDTPDQTQRIREVTIQRALGDSFKIAEPEITHWKNIQRILAQRTIDQNLRVKIPYAREVFSAFPDNPVRVRRDQEKFRVIIEVIAILHQFHRNIIEEDGQNWLISTIADYHLAKLISEETLTGSLFQYPKQSEELLSVIKTHYEPHPDVIFTIKDIADKIKWPKHKVRKFLKYIENSELVKCVYEKKGSEHKYVLSNDESLAAGNFLPDPSILMNAFPCNKAHFYDPLS